MKRCIPTRPAFFSLIILIPLLSAMGFFPQQAVADVSANISIWHGYDFFYPSLNLTASSPAPLTYHQMESASGALWKQVGGTNGASDFFLTNDLQAVIHECTNGLWKLYLNREHPSEELYYFKVSITGVTTSVLGNVTIHSPSSGSSGVTNRPTFHWTGPSNLLSLDVQVSHENSGNSYFASLAGTATNWTPAGTLTTGDNSLFVNYFTNNFPGITFTTPTNGSGGSPAGWSAQGDLHTYLFSTFNVAGPSGGNSSAILFGHYRFDNPSNLRRDSSGLNHDATSLVFTGAGTQPPQYDPNGVDGGGVAFDGYNALQWSNELTNVLSGSYSISLWLNTTETYGEDDDAPSVGASIVDAGSSLPMVQTGSKLAFHTATGNHTLYSDASINSGDFEHLVVTRDAATGEKRIYVNGSLDTSAPGSTGSLPTPSLVRLGHSFDANLDIEGLVDDLQIYTNVLTTGQVEFLFNNPGATAPNTGGNNDLADAVDAPHLVWTTGGDAQWFKQGLETYDGTDAAQSGSINHVQHSWIETTVQGPGVFSFWWKVSSDDFDGYDYLQLEIDGSSESEISGDWDWDYYEVSLPAGTHTLRWTYYKDGDFTAGEDAAFLDQVSFGAPPPVEFSLTISREQRHAWDTSDPNGVFYLAFPNLNSPDPTLSHHRVESPDGSFVGLYGPTNDYSASSSTIADFNTLMNALTNGNWKLWLNKDTPSERYYTFTISAPSLDSNSLPAFTVSSPPNGSTTVAPNPPYQWNAPTSWDQIYVQARQPRFGTNHYYSTETLAGAATSWTGPTLAPGTNIFSIRISKDGQNSSFSISQPYNSWSVSDIRFETAQESGFVVTGVPAQPVLLINPARVGDNFQFQFQSETGRSHWVQSRTNLAVGSWLTRTSLSGDGTLKTVVVPMNGEPTEFYRVLTQ